MNRIVVSRCAMALALLLIPIAIEAQTAPKVPAAPQAPVAQLAFADDETALKVTAPNGAQREIYIGDTLKSGETIQTSSSTAELKLIPNGTVIKISRNTTFRVDALAGETGKDTNEFTLSTGKIRTVAAKSLGTEKYQIRTRSAVCGVRGTDFSLIVEEGKKDAVFVRRGQVEFSRRLADMSTQRILVGAGQFADTFGTTFQPAVFSAEQATAELAELEFKSLKPETVPQAPQVAAAPAEPVKAAATAEAPKSESISTPQKSASTAGLAAPEPVAAAEAAPSSGSSSSGSPFLKALKDAMGFEAGSVTIDEKTYAKAVLQPTFTIGKLKMSLYLPVIYQTDIFNANDWYQPNGNNEWSFGSEYWDHNPGKAARDAATDLALKIRYAKYGDRDADPFFFNIGNLSDMTIGHGSLMRNFANDADFPAIRRVGLNTGLNRDSWGIEAVINDLADPTIYGGRIRFARFFGFSLIADIDPLADYDSNTFFYTREDIGDPMILGTAFDIDIPVIKKATVGLKIFADIATVLPYNRTATNYLDPDTNSSAGLQWKAIYNTDYGTGINAFRNYGFMGGLLGNILFVDWRLEYRHFNGAYRPTMFNASYERNRAQYAMEYANMIADPTGEGTTNNIDGIYGEAAFSLLADKVTFSAGYMMPWSTSSSIRFVDVMRNDYLMARFAIKKGVIPVLGLYGSIAYERSGLAYAVMTNEDGVGLFDADTVLKGELVYPVTENLSLAAIVSTAAQRDEDGNVLYDNGQIKMVPTVTIETRITF